MNIYIIRHGETELNNKGLLQGCDVDSSLNEHGRIQSYKFFDHYNKYPFQKIYISNLKRTYQSVKKFIDFGIKFQKLEGLNEISWGKYQGKKNNLIKYKKLISSWSNGNLNDKFRGGESPLDVKKRQKSVVKRIINDNYDDILICMHGRALRIMLSWLLNQSLSNMDDYPHSNLCLYILKFENNIFRIVKKNDKSHLNE